MSKSKTELYVMYHAGCADGFGAAWAIHQHIGDRHRGGGRVRYLPRNYSDPVPETNPEAEVIIVDFYFPRSAMLALHERHGGRVTLLDHHESAMKELADQVPGCTFDLNESGASLAWKYAQKRWGPPMDTPELIHYLRDRDLWLWELPGSRQVSAAIESYPKDFEVWNGLNILALTAKGKPLVEYQDAAVKRIAAKTIFRDVLGYRVPTVNSANLTSEAGEALLEKYPEAPFAAIYSDVPGSEEGTAIQRWSLRSREGEFNVAELAAQIGGGGHAAAAGFTLPMIPAAIEAPRREEDE